MHLMIIGAGGLGCGLMLALMGSSATFQSITIIDPDVVEGHNLHRQVLFSLADVGAFKAQVAARRWARWTRAATGSSVNAGSAGAPPQPVLHAQVQRVDAEVLRRQLEGSPADLIVAECSDSADLKFAVNDLCVALERPLVIGGVVGVHGTVFARSARGPGYRAVFEAPPEPELAPACAQVGVLGVACGVIGTLMACEVLSIHESSSSPGTAALGLRVDDQHAALTALNLLTLRRQDLVVRGRVAA